MTVCIDAKVSVESLLIYQNLNNATPEFYVVYNYQEEVPTSLYPYLNLIFKQMVCLCQPL
jgi:hypothetical protein